MTVNFDDAVRQFGHGSRRSVVRGVLGTMAAALAGGATRGVAQAHAASSYCAESPEQQMLTLINTHRADNGQPPLSMGQRIGAAAQHHSADMADRNYFSHTTSGSGEGPQQRMLAHGYPANTTWWGENIYAGYGTQNGVDLGSAQAAFTWWKNSPGHNANMLSPNYTVIGIDRSSNPNSQYRNYWTTNFGGAGDPAATLCGGNPPPPPPPPTSPVRLTIVGYQQSSNSTGGASAYDGNATTAWRTNTSGTPWSGWVRFDLGSARALSEIRWQFSQSGSADQLRIQVSTSGTSWQTLATRGNAAAGAWQTLLTTATARYVRFYFSNPNWDRVLGYLSEVEIYGPAGTALTSASTPGDADQATAPAIDSEQPGARRPGGRGRKGRRGKKKRRGRGRKKRG